MPDADHPLVLLPGQLAVERGVALAGRFRLLAKDDERLAPTVAGLHYLEFSCLRLHRMFTHAAHSP